MNDINIPKKIIPSKVNMQNIVSAYEVLKVDISTYNATNIVHDGPPYANGKIHLGHILNKLIKDFILRHDIIVRGIPTSLIHGWDVHGLPIEQKIASQLPEGIAPNKLRERCNDYAIESIQIQKSQLAKYFINIGEYTYKTNSKLFSAAIVENLFSLYNMGIIKLLKQPIHYSIEEHTNLAFSEIEYGDVEHTSVYFIANIENLHVLVWTTQPWTILGSKILIFNPKVQYVAIDFRNEILVCSQHFAVENGYKYTLFNCKSLAGKTYKVADLCQGVVVFDEVASETEGTGILHCAPAHGFQDYELYLKYCGTDEVENVINSRGYYVSKKFKDHAIHHDGNTVLINYLSRKKCIFKEQKITHRYPISWRNKKPLYVLSIEQFVIEINDKTKQAITNLAKKVCWHGYDSLNTFTSYINSRPKYWCISRQRKWGTPICFFRHIHTHMILHNTVVQNLVLEAIKAHGENCWHDDDLTTAILIEAGLNPDKYIKVTDTLDVWFDSGSTLIALKKEFHLDRIDAATYCIEGKDQHRGWFQSLAIVYYLLHNKLPYHEVAVHGFIKTKDNIKLSKSNDSTTKESAKILDEQSPEVIRLFVFASDWQDDIIVSEESITRSTTTFFKLYNLLRYYVNMAKDHEFGLIVSSNLSSHFIKTSLQHVNAFSKAMTSFDYTKAFKHLMECAHTYSEYIRIQKDELYCGDANSEQFACIMQTLKTLFCLLAKLTLVIMPATTCYIYSHILQSKMQNNVNEYDIIQDITYNTKIVMPKEQHPDIEYIYHIYDRLQVTLEDLRQNKTINHGYEISINIINAQEWATKNLEYIQKILEISEVLVNNPIHKENEIGSIVVDDIQLSICSVKSKYHKCTRCWKYFEILTNEKICNRCHLVREIRIDDIGI